VSSRWRSRFTEAPQAARSFWVFASLLSARSRCSSVRYSWRIAFASCSACLKLACSCLSISGVATSNLLGRFSRFHGQAQGELVLPGQLLHHLDFRSRHV